KSDQLRRIADFAAPNPSSSLAVHGSSQRSRMTSEAFGSGTADAFSYSRSAQDDVGFSVVDRISSTLIKKSSAFSRPRRTMANSGAGGGGGARSAADSKGFADKRGGANFARRRWQDKPQRIRDSSVKIGDDWQVVEEVQFSRLNKLHKEVEEPEDVAFYNTLNYLDKTYDRVSTKQQQALRRTERSFYNTTSSQDSVLLKLSKEQKGPCVFATDSILSVLMCASRSVYSWDIVIVKEGNKIFLDKVIPSSCTLMHQREQGIFDWITVNENASEAPLESVDGVETINSPNKLAEEATYVNRFFSQQILNQEESLTLSGGTHPDHDPAQDARYAYRYRKWDLGDEITLFARTQIDAVVHQTGTASSLSDTPASSTHPARESHLVCLHALNEFDSRAAGSGGAPDWRQKIDSQRGAVMASELKNNGAKLARWTAASIIAGADQLRLGFASRMNPRDRTRHVVLATSTFKPIEFAGQINLSMGNAWGVLRAVVDLCLSRFSDGKYVMVKDPNKSVLRIYKVPDSTFEDDDEEDAEDEEEEDEDDDDDEERLLEGPIHFDFKRRCPFKGVMLSSTDIESMQKEQLKTQHDSMAGQPSGPDGVHSEPFNSEHIASAANSHASVDNSLLLPLNYNTKPMLFPTALYPASINGGDSSGVGADEGSDDYNIFSDARYAQSLYHLHYNPPHSSLDFNPGQYYSAPMNNAAAMSNGIHPSLAHIFQHDHYGRPSPGPGYGAPGMISPYNYQYAGHQNPGQQYFGRIPPDYASGGAPASRQAPSSSSRTRITPTYFNSEGVVSAVYANVAVYELTVNNVQVMRRQRDNWINATHILKAAGIEKSQRTKILDRTEYKHEKIQGGYGKFQGTWISLEDAIDLAHTYDIYTNIRPIFELKVDEDVLKK
ncbi:MAG: hypothetical protein SGCHY_001253, partial [Lobulomycetales sp.]